MSEKDKANLLAIVDCCEKIAKFTEDIRDADEFFEEEMIFDAILMNFVVIGESVARLTNQLKDREPEIPWAKIRGFRNMIAHDYFGVDAEEVWQIIKDVLPEFKKAVEKIQRDI